MTPQELEKQRQQEQLVRDRYKSGLKLRAAILDSVDIQGSTQLTGLERINQTINDKVATLQNRVAEQLQQLSVDLNIQGLETNNPVYPNICPSQAILGRAESIRNTILGDMEALAEYINIIDTSLRIVNDALSGSITTVTALSVLKTASSAATKVLPAVPGNLTALLSDLDDIRTILTFKTDGNPRLPELKRAVELGTQYITQAAQALNSLISYIGFIDIVLQNCGKASAEIPQEVQSLINVIKNIGNTDTFYKGFTFEIVDKYFSPTLNQKIGQARNKAGIVLLQTEPSFTQDPQVLIEELKLVIDRDNLKSE